jgi:hypothetical protein
VSAAPPFEAGAVQDTTLWAFALFVADTAVGASGIVDGIAAADGADATEVPLTFVAVTVNV